MNKGQAFYQGERVYFTEVVINPWTRQAEYLIAYDGKARWVRQSDLTLIVYHIAC